MKIVEIGNKKIGDGYPCFISVEPGATHTGIQSAKKLAKSAKYAGADAVKFQTIITDDLMSHKSRKHMIDYKTSNGWKKESIYEALKRRELTFDEWKELKSYCDKLGILFISSPSGESTVNLLSEMNVAAIKVSKSDVNNYYLIKLIARTKLPVIIDAREKFQDVANSIRICEKECNDNIIIMHCPSGYPAEYAGIHLNVIPNIKNIFNRPVAYSDHSLGDYMNYAALGLGVNFLEKTISLNKNIDAVEHYMSLEPDELKSFISKIRQIEESFGDPSIIFNSRVNKIYRRSIITKRNITKGKIITLDDITFKRPGNYLSVEFYEKVLGKKATRNIDLDVFLSENDFE